MLAVLVFMLGRSDCWRALMREELGLATPVIEGIERDFENQVEAVYRKGGDQTLKARSARMRILFRPRRNLQGEEEFVSIAGTTVMLPLGNAEPLEIVGTIGQGWKTEQARDLHNLTRRRALDVVLPDDAQLTDRHVTEFCRTLAEEYVGSVTDQPDARAALDALLAGRARFAEHVASAVRAEIRDQLPKILGEMQPRSGGTLERARKDYEDAVRGAGDGADAIRQDLKDQLWKTVNQPAGHEELLERVRARITGDGYVPARIFFELFQNADDAWQQDPAWTDAPGRFELSQYRGTTTMSHWGRLDPELASWLGGILSSARMVQDEREQALLHLRTATFRMADGRWGPAAFMPHDNERADPEERLISEFVPSEYVLSGDYTGDAISLYDLARGGGHLGSLLAPARLAQFARECKTIEAKRAVVTYMTRGEKGRKLAEELGVRRCSWLPSDFEAFCDCDFAQGLNRNDLLRHVLPHLYASEHEERLDGTQYTAPEQGYSAAGPPEDQPDTALVLERLHAWWTRQSQELCSNYSLETYPANSKPERLRDKHFDDDPEGWFTFFAQGVFRSIEWGNATASRNFIKDAKRAGWWGEMARISQVHSYRPWTDRLDELASIDGKAEDYRPCGRAPRDIYNRQLATATTCCAAPRCSSVRTVDIPCLRA